MLMKSLFEELGGTYRREGDYFVPDLALPSDDAEIRIGSMAGCGRDS